MAEVIQQRQRVQVERFCLEFNSRSVAGWGYAFDCDRRGVVNVAALTPAAQQNYLEVKADAGKKFRPPYIHDWSHSYTEPTVLRCDCGREVILDGFTCECECGVLYNQSGQRLASKSQWGEETGESF